MPHVDSGLMTLGCSFSFNAVTIDLVTQLDFGGLEIEALDATVLASTMKAFIPGLPSPGNMTMEVLMDPGDSKHTTLFALAQSPVIDAFVLTLPVVAGQSTPTTISGNGFITKFGIPGIAPGQLLKGAIEFQLSGPVTLTVGS